MRLIDADVVLKLFDEYWAMQKKLGRPSRQQQAIYRVMRSTVNSAKTEDTIPVVRCKDCKYYQHGKYADDWLWCMMNHHYTDEEKYCAWAERKDTYETD